MKYMQASDAACLAGLTVDQLREWCGRRDLVRPDVPPAGRGRHALYSWQTILSLRLLKELHERYGVQVGAWKSGVNCCQGLLLKRSFPSLWGAHVVFVNMHEAMIVDNIDISEASNCLIVKLQPHLEALSLGMKLPQRPVQPSLFSVQEVRS